MGSLKCYRSKRPSLGPPCPDRTVLSADNEAANHKNYNKFGYPSRTIYTGLFKLNGTHSLYRAPLLPKITCRWRYEWRIATKMALLFGFSCKKKSSRTVTVGREDINHWQMLRINRPQLTCLFSVIYIFVAISHFTPVVHMDLRAFNGVFFAKLYGWNITIITISGPRRDDEINFRSIITNCNRGG